MDSPLKLHVESKIKRLQEPYVHGARKLAAAPLAALRQSTNYAPGSDPRIWEHTLEGLPEQYVGRTDEPSAAERAVHTAMTLYATHQQSKSTPMHTSRRSLGRAVRDLSAPGKAGSDSAKAHKRRFDALVTAVSYAELVHHARGLIGQLRAHDIPLDYGQLAEDLRQLQDRRRADQVRLRWARDYVTNSRNETTEPALTNNQGESA